MAEFNRRELLSGLVATLAAGGVAASADVIEAEPRPLLLVLKIDAVLSEEKRHWINEALDEIRQKDARLPQVIVLSKGMTLEAVLAPRT